MLAPQADHVPVANPQGRCIPAETLVVTTPKYQRPIPRAGSPARPFCPRLRQTRRDLRNIPQVRRSLAEIAHEPPPRCLARPNS